MLIFKLFGDPQEIHGTGSFVVIMTWFGPGGGLNWGGGNQSHRINVSTYQGFKDSWYQSINITRTLGDNRLRFYAFHRFYQRPLLSLVTPTRGVGGFSQNFLGFSIIVLDFPLLSLTVAPLTLV